MPSATAFNRSPFTTIVATTTLLRALLCVAGLVIIDHLIDTGTNPLLLSFAGLIGVAVATSLAARPILTRGMLSGALLLFAVYVGIRALLPLLSAGNARLTLLPAVFRLHIDTLASVFAIAFLTSWGFWRSRVVATLELLLLGATGILLFIGHRQFHFDTPQIVNSLAWRLNVSELVMLVLLGSSLTLLTALYAWLASLAPRPLGPTPRGRPEPTNGRLQWGRALLVLFVIAGAAGVIIYELHAFFAREALARLASGVGQQSQEGLSPLNFNSSVGRSQQPLALARLDSDYPENPLAPKLYLRETVLSKLEGHNLVIASREFDRDLNRSSPNERYIGTGDTELLGRVPIVQSIYLLAAHDNAFALDFPLSITPLKNPNPNRFKGAYKAYSMAPGFALSDLDSAEVGDPRWSDAERRLHIEQHPDARYREKALDIVGEPDRPIVEARRVIRFLNEHAIYTLTPNHTVERGADPVAPFLFGDMRGFCVHFAHATVAMLRGLGIPSRVATGYATDLREAKDGHILLRTNDRHAWAEVYVRGYGWIPFDTDPQQVESHAEAPVDQQILEELMGMLGPDEEILPDDVAKDEPGAERETPWRLPNPSALLLPGLILLALLLSAKLLLRFGWRAIPNPMMRARWAYRSVATSLIDAGYGRNFGETHLEYSQRLQRSLQVSFSELSQWRNALQYGRDAVTLKTPQVTEAARMSVASLQQIPAWRRLFGFLNPTSLLRALIGRWW